MLKNIQALRAFAALSVLGYHFSFLHVSELPIHCGSFGVDLFFVISGFIIAYSADRNAHDFLPNRLIRVLPPYWIATFLGFLILVPRASVWGTIVWLGRSFVFVPGPGGRSTIIFVAWTLVYELAFYLLYALCLLVSRRFAAAVCLPVLLFLAFGVHYVGVPVGPWPLLTEFTFGLAIFLFYRRLGTAKSWFSGMALLLVSVGLVSLYVVDAQAHGLGVDPNLPRVMLFGLPSSMVVLGLLLWERRGVFSSNRWVLMLGGASYAMYLLHPLIMSLLARLPSGSGALRVAWFCFAALLTIACAVLYYTWVEVPVIRGLRRKLLHDRAPLNLSAGRA